MTGSSGNTSIRVRAYSEIVVRPATRRASRPFAHARRGERVFPANSPEARGRSCNRLRGFHRRAKRDLPDGKSGTGGVSARPVVSISVVPGTLEYLSTEWMFIC